MHEKTFGLNSSPGLFYIFLLSYKLFQKVEKEKSLSNSYPEAHTTLIPKGTGQEVQNHLTQELRSFLNNVIANQIEPMRRKMVKLGLSWERRGCNSPHQKIKAKEHIYFLPLLRSILDNTHLWYKNAAKQEMKDPLG